LPGAARTRAIELLELMPPGMRGDFIYIHSGGSVTSNRADMTTAVKFDAPATVPKSATARDVAHPMAYPPTGGSGGVYIRQYSYQGINAAYGVAKPPCDVALNPSNPDTGNMYFNAYDPSGSDMTDAGIGADEYPGRDGYASDVFSWVNSPDGGGWDPGAVSGGYVNPYSHWPCGTWLVIVYGTLPSPNNGTSMLAVGPPNYDPTQVSIPPATVTLQNPSWTFFDTPSSLNSGSGTYQSIPSNCLGCSTALMFTIGEPNGADGACYGACGGSGTADGVWSNVVMGELTSPCGPSSFGLSNPCTLTYSSTGIWYAGNNYPAANTYFSVPDGTTDGTEQYIVEGISDLEYSANDVNRILAVQPPSLPPEPSYACTPDSDGYCTIEVTGATCTFKEVGPKSDPTPEYLTTPGKYEIFRMGTQYLELQGTYTDSINTDDDTTCNGGTSWSPANPATVYNDPNLP
jgi:hypothetical protein